jgi:hypothetical protein
MVEPVETTECTVISTTRDRSVVSTGSTTRDRSVVSTGSTTRWWARPPRPAGGGLDWLDHPV